VQSKKGEKSMQPEDFILEAEKQQKEDSQEALRQHYNRLAARLQSDLDAAPASIKETEEYLPEALKLVRKVEQSRCIADQAISGWCHDIDLTTNMVSEVREGLAKWKAVKPESFLLGDPSKPEGVLLRKRFVVDINAENRLFYEIKPKLIKCRGRRKQLERLVNQIRSRLETLKTSPYYFPQGTPTIINLPEPDLPAPGAASVSDFDPRVR
jgi:hypothetical protein